MPSQATDSLTEQLRAQARALGFADLGVTGLELEQHPRHLRRWLALQRHGQMRWMAQHGAKRWRPDLLEPGTLRVISVRMDYRPADAAPAEVVLDDPRQAYISRYALGRDYHKLMRKRLAQLGRWLEQQAGGQHRALVDSAPVLERAFAERAGLGWIGKNTMLINPQAGSWFFLGEIYTTLPLAVDPPQPQSHCGSCRRCLDLCPTQAFVGPWELDARRCISYLTIEHEGAIPLELRPLMGNRIYGCDDCQLVCPWTKFSPTTTLAEFSPRHQLDQSTLLTLFGWDETTFLQRLEGSPIRRIGHERWLRNLAVALGNAPQDLRIVEALRQRLDHPSPLVQEHVQWALQRQGSAPGNA